MLEAALPEPPIDKTEGEKTLGKHPSLSRDLEKPLTTASTDPAPKHKSLEEWVQDKKAGGKYRKLIDILSDETILRASYGRIQSNPGNMTPGGDPLKETLDGITDA